MTAPPLLRLATPHDAPAVARIYEPIVRETSISFELEPPAAAEMALRIERTLATHPWLVCEAAGEIAGYAYGSSHRSRAAYQWAADVSVYVDVAHRGRSIGRALHLALLSILRAQGFYRACAGIALPNEASIALHERLGFTAVGIYHQVGYKQGAWHDVGWWECALREADGAPQPLRSLQQLAASEIDAALARAQQHLVG